MSSKSSGVSGLGSGRIATTGTLPLPKPTTGGKPIRTTFNTRVYSGRNGSR